MMRWFSSEGELRNWAGPNFEYPYDQASFMRDLNMGSLSSKSLVSSDGEFLGFGQCYLRVNRCHFGRLVVSPDYRGQGVVAQLLGLLTAFGIDKFAVKECSLFVLIENQSAIAAYLKYGFEVAEYPEKMPIENCLYMTINRPIIEV